MPFVKLDCGILDSTLWVDRLARELFITALLMAEPIELREPMQVINGSSLVPDIHFKEIPPGWYGFVAAAGPGIIRRSGIDDPKAGSALLRLAEPDYQSRSPAFKGRRLVRVDGGYIVLNFDKYRNKDHTAAERSKRYREKLASRVTKRASRVTKRSVTQAEAEAEEKKEAAKESRPQSATVEDWLKELETDPTYKGVDVRREYGKMLNWCKVRSKEATKRRFVNWLNNAEKTLPLQHAARADFKPNRLPPPNNISEAELAEKRAKVRELSAKLKAELNHQ